MAIIFQNGKVKKAVADTGNVFVKTATKIVPSATKETYTAIVDVKTEIDLAKKQSENDFADYTEMTETAYEALKAEQEAIEQ